MTITPNTDEALHDTAQDFRNLGNAVKQDLRDLRHTAADSLEDCTHRATQDARESVDKLRDYAVNNPLRALAYAALGGVLVGLYLRR